MSGEERPIERVKRVVRERAQSRAGVSLAERRKAADAVLDAFGMPEGAEAEETTLAGRAADRVRPLSGRTGQILLYFHGGGYVLGSPRSHRHMTALIALKVGCEVVVPDYRLAPENPFPAAVEDGLAAYQALLEEGHDPATLFMGGDSAGGGLTLAVLQQAKTLGLPLPAAACLISPWTDLTGKSETYKTKAEADPMIDVDGIMDMASQYLGKAQADDPLASPHFANFAGLPPLFIQVGEDEILLDDSRQLAKRAEAQGVEVTLDIWPEMIHVWHSFYPMLPEGVKAIEDIAAFMRGKGAAERKRA